MKKAKLKINLTWGGILFKEDTIITFSKAFQAYWDSDNLRRFDEEFVENNPDIFILF